MSLEYNMKIMYLEVALFMKKLKLLWFILKSCNADKMLISFLGFIFLISLIFISIEPDINSYGDAIWYCFSIVTTIGFGDIYAVTLVGRVFTVVLGIYSIFVVALLSGVTASYFIEIQKIRASESVVMFMEKLENLENLSREELAEISSKVKTRKYHI